MEFQSVIYGSIVFMALIFGDLGVTGITAISGPMAALILELEAMRKHRGEARFAPQGTHALAIPKFENTRTRYSDATELAKDSEQLACD